MSVSEDLAKAETLAQAREWSQAADALSDAGESSQVLEKRAFYLSRAERYEEAIGLLEELHRSLPHSMRPLYMLGYQYSQQEQWVAAIEHYQRALKMDPNYLKAHYRLAQAHYRAGHKVQAQLAAMRVLRIWSGAEEEAKKRDARMYARASYLLAKLQLHADPEGAVVLARQAAEHDPHDHNTYYLLGKALTRAGQPSEALGALREAKRIEPRKAYIDIELVRALLESGQREEALLALQRLAKRCRAWDAYNAARLAKRLDQPRLARDLLEEANRRGPTRGDMRIKSLLRELPFKAASAMGATSADQADVKQATGEVVMVNPKRHFGFLVDEQGIKRHFRLKGETSLRKGGRVTFVPTEREKGPAARDVRVAS